MPSGSFGLKYNVDNYIGHKFYELARLNQVDSAHQEFRGLAPFVEAGLVPVHLGATTRVCPYI